MIRKHLTGRLYGSGRAFLARLRSAWDNHPTAAYKKRVRRAVKRHERNEAMKFEEENLDIVRSGDECVIELNADRCGGCMRGTDGCAIFHREFSP